jgi:hypothetical protein
MLSHVRLPRSNTETQKRKRACVLMSVGMSMPMSPMLILLYKRYPRMMSQKSNPKPKLLNDSSL